MSAPFSPRAFLRRQLQFLRSTRSRAPPRRAQSSKNNNNNDRPTDAKPRIESDPVPVPNTIAALPLWQRLGPLTRAAEAYARSQRKRPYVTQVCSSLVIYLCADLSAQRMNESKGYEPERTVRSLIVGAVASIPSFKWFLWLSHSFNYSSRVLSIATKVVVNQIVFTPIFNTYFFGMQALLQGHTLEQIYDRVRECLPPAVVNSLKLWPMVTAVNMSVVPLEYRSVFAGVVAVGWQTYLAFLNRRAEQKEEAGLSAEHQ